MKRKLILNLAISLDGFIATKEGGFDWIKGDNNKSNDTKNQFEFPKFLDEIDTVIMGKNAYLDMPEESYSMYDNLKVYVATDEELKINLKNVEFINGDITSQIKEIQKQEGKDIWLYGGGLVIDPFIKENIVDEYIIGIIPTILGEGIPLFQKDNPKIELNLKECTVTEGITMLRYTKR